MIIFISSEKLYNIIILGLSVLCIAAYFSLANTYIKENQIVGKLVLKVPFVGYLRNFWGSKMGVILVIIIIALMSGLSEIKRKQIKEEKSVNR